MRRGSISTPTLQAVDDPSLAFDPIKVGGDVVLAQHAEVIRALGKRVVHDVIDILPETALAPLMWRHVRMLNLDE
jgi:hypothetical protein